ncbi:MAG: hypothetical protein RSB69_04625 [Odoribacter sp.]
MDDNTKRHIQDGCTQLGWVLSSLAVVENKSEKSKKKVCDNLVVCRNLLTHTRTRKNIFVLISLYAYCGKDHNRQELLCSPSITDPDEFTMLRDIRSPTVNGMVKAIVRLLAYTDRHRHQRSVAHNKPIKTRI